MTLELFTLSGSPYGWRVQLALEYKRVPYTLHVLSVSAGDLKKPQHLARNPRGRVPVLVDGDFTLSESMAIVAYVDKRFPDPPLLGTSARETGAIWRVISEYTSYLDDAVEHFILPIYFGRASAEADAIRAAMTTIEAELRGYDAQLARTPWLVGDSLTAADLVVFPHVMSVGRAASKEAAKPFAPPFHPLAHSFPNLARWVSSIEALPGYDRTYPPHWR